MLFDVVKKLFSTSLPLMSSRLVEAFNTFIIMLVLAQFGPTVLAASLTIGISRLTIMLLFMSPLLALGAVIGRQFGNEKYHDIPLIVKQSRLLALLLACCSMLLFAYLKPLLSMLHQPASILPIVAEFFHYFLWAMPAIYLIVVNQQTLAAMGKQKLVLALSIINFVLCSILNASLALGWFGLPRMEVKGTAIALVIAYWILLGISTLLVRKTLRVARCLEHNSEVYPFFHWGKQVLKIGLPISLKFLSEMSLFFFIMIMTGWLGKLALAASQVSMQYLSFVKVPLVGLGEACSISISQAMGRKDKIFIKHMFTAPLILAILVVILIGGCFLIFHRQLLDLFIHSEHENVALLYQTALILLFIRIADAFCEVGNLMSVWTLRGMYDTQYPMWVSVIFGWLIMAPLAALLAFGFHFGIVGLAIGEAIGWLVISLICLRRLKIKITHQLQQCT